jgi:hypothetical protein
MEITKIKENGKSFKLGDEVIYTSGYFGYDDLNPLLKFTGRVTNIVRHTWSVDNYKFAIEVKWDNGYSNVYRSVDLELFILLLFNSLFF